MTEIENPKLIVESRFSSLDSNFPGRVYVFNSGFKNAFGGDIRNAITHYRDVVGNFPDGRKEKYGIMNGIMWGFDDGAPNMYIDFFGWNFDGGLFRQSNPGIVPFVTKNGNPHEPTKEEREATCEKGLIVMAGEGRHRLTSPDARTYFQISPKIDWVEYSGVVPSLDTVTQVWNT